MGIADDLKTHTHKVSPLFIWKRGYQEVQKALVIDAVLFFPYSGGKRMTVIKAVCQSESQIYSLEKLGEVGQV